MYVYTCNINIRYRQPHRQPQMFAPRNPIPAPFVFQLLGHCFEARIMCRFQGNLQINEVAFVMNFDRNEFGFGSLQVVRRALNLNKKIFTVFDPGSNRIYDLRLCFRFISV